MLKFHSITLNNFRSYKGNHYFEFPAEAGLYFFGGINLVDKIGGNGAGKSTFLDAIMWCLYGKTSRGLKGNEIISNWDNVNTKVELDLTIGERFTIKRTQRPNSLLLNEKPVDQQELQKHLCLNFEAFLHSVLNAQFGESFFSLTPSAKLTLFSDINNLEFWLEKSEEAAKQAEIIQVNLNEVVESINKLRGKKSMIHDDLESLIINETEFSANRDKKIKELQTELKSLDLLEVQKQQKDIFSKIRNSEIKIKELKSKISVFETRQDSVLVWVQKQTQSKERILGEIAAIKRQLDVLKGLGDVCPTCLQAVHNTTLEDDISVIEKDLYNKQDVIEAIARVRQGYTKELVVLKGKIDSFVSEYEREKVKRKNLDEEAFNIDSKIIETQTKRKNFTEQIETLLLEKNPYSVLIDEKEKLLITLKKNLKINNELRQQLTSENEAISFWIKGFKRLRLFIIEQAFNALEIEVNNSLAQLGLPDWQVTFDIERENKKGGITKGFVVFIKSPHNAFPVRWENWSGGETQRLQLAGDLGLSNLIMTQAGLHNTIEFYDEPSTHLSHEGMLDLAAMLHERALAERKQIWIVDHTAVTNFGKFKGTITAIKDSNGSSVRYEGN
jgi:DNA repair exonuclease SbcCD ATPase subunit